MSTLQMQQEDHPAHNMPDATEQYAATELPASPWSDLGNYNIGSSPRPTEVGPRKAKGSDKMPRPPIRPGD